MTEGDQAGCSSNKQRAVFNDYGFTTTVLSWFLDDIFDTDRFKCKVEKIPISFQSQRLYLESFKFPLLEETRAQLHSGVDRISTAPFSEVVAIKECKPYEELYEVKVDSWRNRSHNSGKEPYKTLPGDIFFLADAVPEADSDLRSMGRMWTLLCVTKLTEGENDTGSTCFNVKASKNNQIDDTMKKSMFLIFLTNIIPNRRIWCSLHMSTKEGNVKIIEKILCSDSADDENCRLCSQQSEHLWDKKLNTILSSHDLNDSQVEAVSACLHSIGCKHKVGVELIWGPPGTGKTKTVSVLLFTLLRMKCGTLVCTPTNVAITEVASRVVNLVKESFGTDYGMHPMFCPLGDILLFGNKERLNYGAGMEDIYLDNRIERLARFKNFRHCFDCMIDFLENCVSEYRISVENELLKEEGKNKVNEKDSRNDIAHSNVKCQSFLEFARKRFQQTATSLKNCIIAFCTHMPKKFISENTFQEMVASVGLLDSLETLLFQDNVVSKELEELFLHSVVEEFPQAVEDRRHLLQKKRSECHSTLKILRGSLNGFNFLSIMSKESLTSFCFGKASLIFCTASSSYKLHSEKMEPLDILVIDEAAQLKECESTIPLQLEGIKHAILIGDECQLPAMVESRVSVDAGFGRSLFQRLKSLGYSKHLLNVQYRMHPAISFFPNSQFYDKQIQDGPNVKQEGYERQYFPGKMFGPYSFINITDGAEEGSDVGHSFSVRILLRRLSTPSAAQIKTRNKLLC